MREEKIYILTTCWNTLYKSGPQKNRKVWTIRAKFSQKSFVCVKIIFFRLKKNTKKSVKIKKIAKNFQENEIETLVENQ
jgi:late competence protein required for DNA uptake (superfamily II DNA/RNA helicase)